MNLAEAVKKVNAILKKFELLVYTDQDGNVVRVELGDSYVAADDTLARLESRGLGNIAFETFTRVSKQRASKH